MFYNPTKHIYIIIVAFIYLSEQIICPTFAAKCSTNEDCYQIYNRHYICSADDKCGHEPLWPITTAEGIGYALIVVISAFANAGGLGGGAVIVPIYMFLFNYITPEAIPLSKATILAGAIMNVCQIINRRRSDDSSSLVIDFPLGIF